MYCRNSFEPRDTVFTSAKVVFHSPCAPTCRYAAAVRRPRERAVRPHHHCCVCWPGMNWGIVSRLMIGTRAIYMSCQQGTHESLRGNSRALSTVTAIIDGTGSIGVYGIGEIDLFCFYKLQKKQSRKKSNKCKSKIKKSTDDHLKFTYSSAEGAAAHEK